LQQGIIRENSSLPGGIPERKTKADQDRGESRGKDLGCGRRIMGSECPWCRPKQATRFISWISRSAITDRALRDIRWSVEKLEAKGFLREPSQKVLSRILPEKDLSVPSGVDWIIEAALEEEGLKRDIFQELDRVSRPETPPGDQYFLHSHYAPCRKYEATPERVLGLHFLWAVPLMGLVEVIKGEKTSAEIFERGVTFDSISGENPGSRST